MKPNHRTHILALAAALAGALGTVALAQTEGAPAQHGRGHGHGHAQGHGHGHAHGHGQMKSGDCPHECMHGAKEGTHGCPLHSVGAAEVKVENTKDGAVIRLAAKDPARIDDVQRAAAAIAERIAAHAPARSAPAARPSKQ
jgi:hypothetical protein